MLVLGLLCSHKRTRRNWQGSERAWLSVPVHPLAASRDRCFLARPSLTASPFWHRLALVQWGALRCYRSTETGARRVFSRYGATGVQTDAGVLYATPYTQQSVVVVGFAALPPYDVVVVVIEHMPRLAY